MSLYHSLFIPDNFSLQHPSIFQNPARDVLLNDDPTTAKATNPNIMWFASSKGSVSPKSLRTPKSEYLGFEPTIGSDPKDPPLTLSELHTLIKKLQYISQRNFDNVIPTLLFCTFFSKYNIDWLQKEIKINVWKLTGHVIGDQGELDLKNLMENIYPEYADEIDQFRAPSKILFKHIRKQIGRLDQLTLNVAVPIIINQVEQHLTYLKQKDIKPGLDRPVASNIFGTMQYRSPSAIFSTSPTPKGPH